MNARQPDSRVSGMLRQGSLFTSTKVVIKRFLSRKAHPVAPPLVLRALSEPCPGTRYCIFAHYSPVAQVAPPVYRHLGAISKAGYSIIFVSTAPALSDADCDRLGTLCCSVMRRDNRGLDFASWKSVLDLYPGLKEASELLLANDSVYVHSDGLAHVFAVMEKIDCDFWGLTESGEGHPHLQSYFLLFRKGALCHPAFSKFWGSVGILPRKKAVIDCYEVGLTWTLARAGLRVAAYVPVFCAQNPVLAHPEELMQRFSLPVIKRSCLQDNLLRPPLHNWDKFFSPDEAVEIKEHLASLNEHPPLLRDI